MLRTRMTTLVGTGEHFFFFFFVLFFLLLFFFPKETFSSLSLHKNPVVITMIIPSHIYQHYTASHLKDAAKYIAYTLWHFSVAAVYKIKHFMLARRQFA